MGQIGGLMFFLGLVSAGMHFLGREVALLIWIDSWGDSIGWVIRGGLIIVGAGLWLMSRRNGQQHVE